MPKTVAAFGGTEALQAFNSRAHDPLTPYFAATFAAFIPRPVLPGLSEKRFKGIPLDDIERLALIEALKVSNWVQKDAAELLAISPRVMNYKIKVLGIELPRSRRAPEQKESPAIASA